MNSSRPDVSELEVAASDSLVFRFDNPGHLDPRAPAGARLQNAALQTDEFTPHEGSYGASVYVKSRLLDGIADLHRACDKWRGCRVAEVPVAAVLAVGARVVLSPQDCQFESIKHAHASLLDVTKARRNKLIRVIEAHLLPVA